MRLTAHAGETALPSPFGERSTSGRAHRPRSHRLPRPDSSKSLPSARFRSKSAHQNQRTASVPISTSIRKNLFRPGSHDHLNSMTPPCSPPPLPANIRSPANLRIHDETPRELAATPSKPHSCLPKKNWNSKPLRPAAARYGLFKIMSGRRPGSFESCGDSAFVSSP